MRLPDESVAHANGSAFTAAGPHGNSTRFHAGSPIARVISIARRALHVKRYKTNETAKGDGPVLALFIVYIHATLIFNA